VGVWVGDWEVGVGRGWWGWGVGGRVWVVCCRLFLSLFVSVGGLMLWGVFYGGGCGVRRVGWGVVVGGGRWGGGGAVVVGGGVGVGRWLGGLGGLRGGGVGGGGWVGGGVCGCVLGWVCVRAWGGFGCLGFSCFVFLGG